MSRTITRWAPRWRLSIWRVYLHEWRYDLLDKIGATTGLVIEITPPRWIWIKLLAWCASSTSERIRIWAMRRWQRIEVTYWRSLRSEDDERAALPPAGRVV